MNLVCHAIAKKMMMIGHRHRVAHDDGVLLCLDLFRVRDRSIYHHPIPTKLLGMIVLDLLVPTRSSVRSLWLFPSHGTDCLILLTWRDRNGRHRRLMSYFVDHLPSYRKHSCPVQNRELLPLSIHFGRCMRQELSEILVVGRLL